MALVITLLVLAAVTVSGDLEYSRTESPVIATESNSTCFPESWKSLIESYIIFLPESQAQGDCVPVKVLRCYCLILDTDDIYSIGHCFYGCFFINHPPSEYQLVSIDNQSVTNGTCSQFNREGVLCGQCREGYGPPVYSFSLKCVPCRNVSLWTTASFYVLMAYGPLTVFLVVIVFFTLGVNSAPLRGFILVCQLLSSNISLFLIVTFIDIYHLNTVNPFVRIFHSVYGLWNLDFFRLVYKPFCLHPSLTTLQVMSLDYIIAAYPLVLIIGTYVLVDLYSRNYRPVVIVGRVFHHCCIRFRHQLDIRTSLVDAFGTFFSLSYVKFLATSVNLLMSTRVWNSHDTITRHVYFDGTMEFFKGDHIPFAIAALTLGILCNIVPLIIILLYSFPRAHVVLNILPVSVRTAMFPFMDNILACYKDGTNGTRNCRYFGVVYHIALLAFMLSNGLTLTVIVLGVKIFVCVLLGMLVAVIQPYKSKVYNTVDIILILGVGLGSAGGMSLVMAYIEAPSQKELGLLLATVPGIIPFLYIVGYVGYRSLRKFYHLLRNCFTPSLKDRLSSLIHNYDRELTSLLKRN